MLASGRIAAQAQKRLPEFPAHTEDLAVPTSFGTAALRVYRPKTLSDTPPAVHVNFHGGGYVLAITALDDPLCRAIAALAGVVVVNVDYVVAPQNPFPQAPHQAHEVMQWVATHGDEHGWDGAHLSIGGQSAGGGLAAAAARLALERGTPDIALQVLHYPPLDLTVPAGSKSSTIDKPMLRPWMGEIYDTSYVADPAQRGDRLASPAGPADQADIRGIAPAVVIAAEQDILRAEAQRYADRLRDAGSLLAYREVADVDHGYDLNDDEKARQQYALIAADIQQAHRRSR